MLGFEMVHLHKWNTQCIRTSERRPLALFASISSEGCCRASDKKQRGGFAILTSEHQALAVATQEMQGGTTGIFVFFLQAISSQWSNTEETKLAAFWRGSNRANFFPLVLPPFHPQKMVASHTQRAAASPEVQKTWTKSQKVEKKNANLANINKR